MPIQISTHGDVLRHTAKRVAVAAGFAVLITAVTTLLHHGTDMEAPVSTGSVVVSSILAAAAISTLLAGLLVYRSMRLMQQLTLARAELARIAHTDQLTGLLNRRGFDEAANAALRLAQDAGLPAVVIMCDIDRFKSINDRFGHDFGDRVIGAIADVLRLFAEKERALVARHGGEEFAALMTGITHDQAAQMAEELRRACAAREVLSGEISARVTISIGFTVADSAIELAKIMRVADQALYAAKHRGRDRVVRADELALAAA